MNKCICNGELGSYDFTKTEIEDGFLVCKGTCSCFECEKEYKIEEMFKVDWNKPFDTLIEKL